MCSVVLYGCETWSVILREEHRLRVWENRILRKIFWTKKDEVTGEWRRQRDEELHGLYQPNIIREMKNKMGEAWVLGTCGGEERCIQSFGGET
jgi:hypothetical protein